MNRLSVRVTVTRDGILARGCVARFVLHRGAVNEVLCMMDVLIVGCGIVGAAAAYELSKYRLHVGVLEKENDVADGTTKANSAILHAGYDPAPGSNMARLNVRGVALAKQLCAALDVPYRECGSLVVAFTPEQCRTLEELKVRGDENGVPRLELLGREAVHHLEPNLSPDVMSALYAPTAAICSPWEYCLALAETAVRNGVELHLETAVMAIARIEGGWRVETTQGTFEARCIVNAAGVAADYIHDLALPHAFSIHPSKGEYYLLDKAEGTRVNRTIFQCPGPNGKGVLVSPTVHGNLIVGPNAEPSAAGDTSTTADGMAFVREKAALSVPSIAFGQNIRNFAGVRAHADRDDFILQQQDGFVDAAGICSPGLSAAPAIAEEIAELLRQAGLDLEPKADFVCERRRIRFKELSAAERAELVAKEPAYGRVICRCETVTEGEILAAIHGVIPPRSVDAVKRRVSAGMGRCQGGFCGPRVVELLARELGLSPGEILQDKAGTQLLFHETKGGCTHG